MQFIKQNLCISAYVGVLKILSRTLREGFLNTKQKRNKERKKIKIHLKCAVYTRVEGLSHGNKFFLPRLIDHEEVDHFKSIGSVLTRDGYCTREIKMRIDIAKEAFNRKILLLTSKLNIELEKKLVRCYVWSISL